MSTELMRFPGVGTVGEQSTGVLRVLFGRTAPKLHSGCKNAKGCLGKSEKDFLRKHLSQEAPTPTRVEKLATTRIVKIYATL